MKWAIHEMYGCWVAESNFGFTVWARSLEELEAAFRQ